MIENKTELFNIVCRTCLSKSRNSQTHVHIDWEKRKWMYICLDSNCGATEVYDEQGKCILTEFSKGNDKNVDLDKKPEREIN